MTVRSGQTAACEREVTQTCCLITAASHSQRRANALTANEAIGSQTATAADVRTRGKCIKANSRSRSLAMARLVTLPQL